LFSLQYSFDLLTLLALQSNAACLEGGRCIEEGEAAAAAAAAAAGPLQCQFNRSTASDSALTIAADQQTFKESKGAVVCHK